jgi:hypothetical protein
VSLPHLVIDVNSGEMWPRRAWPHFAGQFQLSACPRCIRVREGAICNGTCGEELVLDDRIAERLGPQPLKNYNSLVVAYVAYDMGFDYLSWLYLMEREI